MCTLVGKLKRLKQEFQEWNGSAIYQQQKRPLKKKYDEDPTVDNQQVLSKAKDDLINMQALEETYWQSPCRLLEGDRNTFSTLWFSRSDHLPLSRSTFLSLINKEIWSVILLISLP